jgi:serine/threonine protein kinase
MEGEDPLVAQCRIRVGRMIGGKWRLDALIGVGGMAAVYMATHRNGSMAAVKILHEEVALNTEVRERFLREAYIANKVNHPGTVKVLDDDKDENGAPYIVMELLQGESVDARAQKSGGRLSIVETLDVLDQVLAVLEAAHKQTIVHRDLKPENLFFAGTQVKVLDFGIARLREATAGPAAMTRTGRTMGTPAFMPPEQALGKSRDIDGQTDLWAVGATMFTLLSGKDVHQAETVSEQLVFAATKPSRSLAVVAPEMPPEVVHVVDRAISFAKPERWADAKAMRDAVAEAHEAVFGESIEASLALLKAEDDLGPLRSASPRAFAPTVPSNAPPVGSGSSTVPSTELRASQLGSGHPTTGGGAFSIEGPPRTLTQGTLASFVGSRKRSLGIGVVAAAVAILGSVSLLGPRSSGSFVRDPALLTSGAPGTDDLATAMPVGLESPALAEVKPEPAPVAVPVAAPVAHVPPPPVAPSAPAQPGASHVKDKPSAAPPAPTPATSASAAAAQGGIVVTVPY